MDPPLHDRLTREATSGILHLGGTILGTSRTKPLQEAGRPEMVVRNLNALNVGAVVAIGGEDTLGVATKLHQSGVNLVGVPKTIDNDLSGTDLTFGFDTAVQIATEAIDRLHSTAESAQPGVSRLRAHGNATPAGSPRTRASRAAPT